MTLTREQKIERIREACVKANKDRYIAWGNDNLDQTIRLADVLLVMREQGVRASKIVLFLGFDVSLDNNINPNYEVSYDHSYWNLRADDLTLQSDPTIDFLDEVLDTKI